MKYSFILLFFLFSIPGHLFATDCNEEEIPIIITVITADFGSDTFWELTNDVTGEQYGTSGFFLVDNTTYIDTLCVPDGSQLTFTVTCCVNNMGSYKVEMLGVTIVEQGNFQFNNQISFIASSLPELDAELSVVDLPDNLLRGPQVIGGKITNLGSTTIESLDVNWRLGSQTFTHHIEGLQLQAFEDYEFIHEQKWQAETGISTFIVFISNINGVEDNVLINNSKVKEVAVHNVLSERTVLYESFTNASCSICASADPNFSNTVLGNPAIAAISYHSSFPGFDPMYSENPLDVDVRLQHHQVLGVPYSVIEGGLLRDGTQFILSNHVNEFRATDALINISVIERMVEGAEGEGDKVVLEVYLTPTATIESPNLRLQTAIVEREVLYEDSPGTNGLTDFYYVMRKLLPNANGTPLSNLEANLTQHFSFEYEVADYIKNREELRSVIFVEDSQTSAVFQALRTNDTLGKNLHSNLQKLGASFGYITADVEHNRCAMESDGEIDIEVFGETDNLQFLWSNGKTGTSITDLEAGIYELQITTVNGTVNEYVFEVFAPKSFDIEASSTPDTGGEGNGSASIEVLEGQAPFLFQWSTGEPTPMITNKTSGIYSVTVTDAFGCHQTIEVVIDEVTDIEGFSDFNNSFVLYPNPAKNQISLQWKTTFSENVEVAVFSVLGEKMHTFTLDLASMQTQTILDVSHFEAGVYLLKGSIGEEVFSKRFYVLD